MLAVKKDCCRGRTRGTPGNRRAALRQGHARAVCIEIQKKLASSQLLILPSVPRPPWPKIILRSLRKNNSSRSSGADSEDAHRPLVTIREKRMRYWK